MAAMSQLSARKGPILWTAVITGVVTVLVFPGDASSDPAGSAPAPLSRQECGKFTGQVDAAESHEVYDAATQTLLVTVGDKQFQLTEGDPSCKANLLTRRRLAQAKSIEDGNRRDLCSSFGQAIAERRTEEKGRPVNLVAAQQYVAENCGSKP